MHVFPDPTSTDELEFEVQHDEPSHVHIPRPSRRDRGVIADQLTFSSLDNSSTRCSCVAD
jgi:hypothetical protein